jgi:hypothetical protein
MKSIFRIAILISIISLLASLTACSGSSSGSYRSHMSYGSGYRGYYGARPWGHYPGYVGRPIDPDWGVDPGGPSAVQLPEMGMPDMGGMDMDMGMGMDMGGFDF